MFSLRCSVEMLKKLDDLCSIYDRSRADMIDIVIMSAWEDQEKAGAYAMREQFKHVPRPSAERIQAAKWRRKTVPGTEGKKSKK